MAAPTATRQVVAALAAIIEPHLSSNFKADVQRQLAAAQPPPIKTPVTATVDTKKTVGVAKMMGQSFIQGFLSETTNQLNSGRVTKSLASPAQAKAASESGKKTGHAYGDGVATAIASPAQTKATSDAGAKHGKSFGTGFGSTLKGVIAGLGIAGLLSKATTGASTFFKGVIAEGKEAAVVGRQTEASLKATGGAAGRTREQIEALSASLSRKIGIDDEEIQKNANMLLSYRRVSGEIFDRAVPAVQDLSAKMGIGGVAAAKLLGKALNDPMKGTAGLAKAGIKLTESQKEQIEKAIKLGDVQKAQGIILGQLEKVVGGQAAASVTGAERQKVAWANFQEEIGNRLFPAMERFRNFVISSVIPALSGLWSGLTGGKEKLAGVAGQFQEFGQKVIAFVNEWKPKIASFVEPGIEAVKTFISYIHGNKDARTLIGALALAGVAFLAFNVIMSANPISLVIIAIAALVVGLTKLYKSSDDFRKFWDGTIYPIFKLWVSYMTNIVIPGIIGLGKTVVGIFKTVSGAVQLAWSVMKPPLASFTGGMSEAGERVNAVWKVIQPAFQGIGNAVRDAWTKTISPALKSFTGGVSDVGKNVNIFWKDTVQPAFKGVGAVIHDAWTKFIQPALKLFTGGVSDAGKKVNIFWKDTVAPAFKGIGNVIHDAWTKFIQPALKLFTGGIADSGKKVNAFWKEIVQPAFKAIGTVIHDAWAKLIQPALKAFITITGDLGTKIRSFWQTIAIPAFKGISSAVSAAWNIIQVALKAFITTVLNVGKNVNGLYVNYVRPAFSSMRDHISAAWVFIRDKVFSPMKTFVTETMPAAFRSGVEAIRGIWNTLKSAAAKPVLFVLETVYQNGIRKGWQALVAKIPGVPSLPDLSANVAMLKVASLNTGGPVRGPGTPTSDSVPIMASDQEYMLRAKSANKLKQTYGSRALDYINEHGDFPPMYRDGGQIQGYKAGGDLGDLARSIVAGQSSIQAVQKLYYNKGGKGGVTSTYRPGDPGHHGQGLAVDFGGFHQDDVATRLMSVGSRILEMIHSSNGKHYGIKRGNMYNFGSQLWGEHENHLHLAAHASDVGQILAGNATFAGAGSGLDLGSFVAMVLKKNVFAPLYDKLAAPFAGKPGGDGLFNQTATGITGFAIKGIKDAVMKVLGNQTMPDPNGGGGPVPPGYIPTYFTYFGGANDASTAGRMMANGEPPSRPAFSSSYWPLGTVATIDIGGHKERLIQKDLGPNKFVYDRHPGINVIDLTYNAMKKFRNPPTNTTGGIKVESWGGGRTLYGFRAKGYDQGGLLEHGDLGLNLSGKPETVLTNDESKGLKSMASDLTSPYSSIRKGGGGNSTLVLKVMLDGTEITDRIEYVLEEHDEAIIRHLAKN